MDGATSVTSRVFTALFLFAGIGVGALGFLDARVCLRGVEGRVQSLGGIDLDPVACRSFERLTHSPCWERDLGTMTGAELRALVGDTAPDFVFMSAPCQGFSGLLSEEKSRSAKYEALNRLALAGVALVLDAWGDDGPGLVLFENVPRIATRGKGLLKEIRTLLRAHGYVTHEGTHNCGEIGNLAQSRERFLMVARHARKVPVFLYQPPKRPLRPCGEVIETLPLPGERSAGRLHQMPAISLRTWLRLAAIRPGRDWRDLTTLDGEPRPAWARYAVTPWNAPTGAVAGTGTNSAWGVADVRVEGAAWHAQALGVVPFAHHFGAITGRHSPTNGAYALADVRVEGRWHRGVLGVVEAREAFGTITGNGRPVCGAFSYADLRVSPRAHGMHWRVLEGGSPAPTVTGTTDVQAGAPSLADLRITCNPWQNSGVLGVLAWSRPSYTVTGALDLWAGWAAVADPRAVVEVDDVVRFEGDGAVQRRGPARARGRRPMAATAWGPWWSSDPRVPSNPRLVVRWRQHDLDAAPPYLPVIPGRGDGSWHRPITLLERAALQGLPTRVDGAPLELEGTLSKVAKHIGNAVPKGAALAIAGEILRTLLLASTGAFMLSSSAGVWVRRRRDGSFPLYLDDQLPRVKRRKARKVRRAVARIEAATVMGAWSDTTQVMQ